MTWTTRVCRHRGMVGAMIARELHRRGYQHVLTRNRTELDLENRTGASLLDRRSTWCIWRPPRWAASWPNQNHPVDFALREHDDQCNVIAPRMRPGCCCSV